VFRQATLRDAKIARHAIPVRNTVRRIVVPYSTLAASKPRRIRQVALAYAIIRLVKQDSKIAQDIVFALLTIIMLGDDGICDVLATTKVLIAFNVPDSRMVMLNAGMLFNTDGDRFPPAAETFFLEFAATKEPKTQIFKSSNRHRVSSSLGDVIQCELRWSRCIGGNCRNRERWWFSDLASSLTPLNQLPAINN
jgi:hypothetical protein